MGESFEHKIPPYEGDQPYLFISYAHKDVEEVYKIVEHLSDKGCRVWHDKGIEGGEEWSEEIADHIERCAGFLSFISQNYLASEHCKNELAYVTRDRLLVYLEDVKLSGGMAMSQSRIQALKKYEYESESDFYAKLMKAPMIMHSQENFFRDASVNKKTSNELKALKRSISSVSEPVPSYAENSGSMINDNAAPMASGQIEGESANHAPAQKRNKKMIILAASLSAVIAAVIIAAVIITGVNASRISTVIDMAYSFAMGDDVTYAVTYTGEWKNGRPDGQGSCTFGGNSSYVAYEGLWEKGIPVNGWMTDADGGIYEGEWQDGKFNENGKGWYATYEGDWKDGKYSGQGTRTGYDENGKVYWKYEGEWKDGKYNGQGTYTRYDENEKVTYTYEGEFQDGKRNGQGTYTWYDENGNVISIYEGEWKDDKFVG